MESSDCVACGRWLQRLRMASSDTPINITGETATSSEQQHMQPARWLRIHRTVSEIANLTSLRMNPVNHDVPLSNREA
jgi:hypothetical protein